jgi:two-component system CheB/CheR fusion protein
MMAMRDGAGKIVGYLKILRDHTDARRAQEALEESRAELWEALQENERARDAVEAASRAKDRFLAILSHELRTPLNPVLMATHILEQGIDDPETKREIIEMIRRNIGSEVQLIDDLLDVTRIGRGKLAIARAPVDLHQAVRRAVEVTDGEIQAKELKLTVSLEAERHQLSGDFTRLQQVVWNLLRNAAKFTPNQGEIRVSSRNEGGQILVSVADTGIGIDQAELQTVFDAFAQANSAISREYGGLGLGLAIANAVIEAHEGRILVESEGRGKGATFTIELPLQSNEDDANKIEP